MGMKRVLAGCLLSGMLATAVQVQNWITALLIALVCMFFLARRRISTASGYMTIRGHSHGGAYSQVCLHEGGHAAAAERVGGKVLGGRVTGSSNRASGYTTVSIPNDPASQIGVYLAGFAAAPGTTSPNDMLMVDEVLASVPSPFRGRILSEGQHIASSVASSSNVKHYAKKLERRGSL